MTGVKQPSYEMESYVEEERTRRQEKPRLILWSYTQASFTRREKQFLLCLAHYHLVFSYLLFNFPP